MKPAQARCRGGRGLPASWWWWLYAASGACLVAVQMVLDVPALYVLVGASAVVAVVAGVRLNRPASAAPWLVLAAGLLLSVTADLVWELHAGRCPEHGWFQAEVISRPPREIFAVNKPFGVARRLTVNGQEVFSFPTVWNSLPVDQQRRRVDPFDPAYWQVVVPEASR